MTRATVWSKDQCPYCVMAKDLLRARGMEYEERNISQGTWTREQLMEAVPGARTLPQIFIDHQLIGSYDQLKKYFQKN